jgi:hypothetical protein
MNTNSLFATTKPIIGVVHLLPLPGSPHFAGNLDAIIERSIEEVQIFKQGGVNGIIIENFHDVPFSNSEITKAQLGVMASAITLARRGVNIPLGVNVHFNDWEAEIALAYSCKAQFVRVEAFVDTVITPAGIVQPCCAEVARYRKMICENQPVEIWADIHPKYSKVLVPNSLHDSARMAQNALADCIIVTGETTGVETPLDDLKMVKEAVHLPIMAGSGTNVNNVKETLEIADGVIVGSAFKVGGDVNNMVSLEKVTHFMKAAQGSQAKK